MASCCFNDKKFTSRNRKKIHSQTLYDNVDGESQDPAVNLAEFSTSSLGNRLASPLMILPSFMVMFVVANNSLS